jgi:starch synthase
MKPIRVLSVVSEIYPLIKTGGLADVAGALPVALGRQGVDVRTLVPGYPAVMNALERAEQLLEWPAFGGNARLIAGSAGALQLLVLDAPQLFDRPGNPYLSPDGLDWPDNGRRFAALARMASEIGTGAVPSFQPDIVHVHDWQAALTPAYLHYSGRQLPRTMLTVHNLAYQGLFPREILEEINLPPESFAVQGVEYYGKVGFLKAGLQFADLITTVSPMYAKEIQVDEEGKGFDGLLRARSAKLRGVLNGIDIDVWNPATDPAIARKFNRSTLDDRAANRAALQDRLGLERRDDAFIVGVISRLSWQKGLDLLLECIPQLPGENVQIALLGTGDAELEHQFKKARESRPKQIGAEIGFDETLAHQIQAGADAIAVPSRFEPCGLTQLCALRYGAVPIVAGVGGLEDTVVDIEEADKGQSTGYKFRPVTSEQLAGALKRALTTFNEKKAWRALQIRGMSTDVSWSHRARKYVELYRELTTGVP